MSTPTYPPPSSSVGQQQYPQTAAPKGNGLGIAALVLGIVSLALCWIPVINFVSIVCGIVGLVLGIIGIVKSHRVMSIVGSACAVLGIVLGIALNVAVANEVDRQLNQPPAGVTQPR